MIVQILTIIGQMLTMIVQMLTIIVQKSHDMVQRRNVAVHLKFAKFALVWFAEKNVQQE